MVRTMAVVLRNDEAAAVVRAEDAAAVSLAGTRDVAAAAELPPLLFALVAAAEVWAGASDVAAGSSEVEAGAAEDAGASLDGAGAAEDAAAADDVAGAAVEEATELPPVPEAWRFSLWWRYSLMPSMCRPSKLKACVMANNAKSVTNSHAWRIMMLSGRGNESVRI